VIQVAVQHLSKETKVRKFLMVLVLGGILFAIGSAMAADVAAPRTVSVTGESEIRVVPDEVVITLGIVVASKEIMEVKKLSDKRMKELLTITAAAGIPSRDVQTDFLNIDRDFTTDSNGRRTFVGYVQRTTVEIFLRDLGKFEALLTAVLQAGIEHVHGIDFRTSELRQHRDQARSLAIKAAKEKATALAGELGEKIGKPHSIQEVQNYLFSTYRNWWGRSYQPMSQNVSQAVSANTASQSNALAPGSLSIRASVNVSFELQ